MNRRQFVASFPVLAITLPNAKADSAPRRIGVLLVSWSPESKVGQAFRQGLRDAGYSEGRDLLIEWRFTEGEYGPVPKLVSDLIQHKVEVIVVDTTVATRAAKRATSAIPVVMTSIADPVGSGLVTSLGHPGGNVTGLSIMATDLTSKRLEVLKDTVPGLTRVAILWNPDTPPHIKAIEQLRSLAPSLGVDLSLVQARRTADLGLAVSDARHAHAQALYVLEDAVFVIHRKTLNGLVEQARLPAIFAQARVVEEGGFMSYGPDFPHLYHRAAGYVDKILKGAKPGDLPIEQPTKFELVVNLKTAKALGITIPESILLRADEVIR